MTLPTWLTRLPSLLAARSRPHSPLLESPQWFHVARCERLRVDRNGSTLSILSFELPHSVATGRALVVLSEYLSERLRLTDTAGWQSEGRLGVLLPDTPRCGGEMVAAEIADFLDGAHGPVPVQISVYPDDASSGLDNSTEQETVAPGNQSPVGAGVAPSEAAFAMPLPWWKRTVDILGASAILLGTSPALLALAATVAATSRGGAFYRQEREGLAGKRFTMLKLRTMVADADRIKHRLRRHSVQDGPAFKMYRDPRVTSIGRFLRATSLDELPQLINVLRGDMSLVGPRPLPVDESLACKPWQRQRLQVTPGITCTWQVSGRNTVSFEEWMRMDLRYVKQRSLWRDLRLLVATPTSVLLSRGPR